MASQHFTFRTIGSVLTAGSVVGDHMFSIHYGFTLGTPPTVLSDEVAINQ